MSRPDWPAQVTVIGTGAMACRFGAGLARAGLAVTLAGRWSDGLAALRRAGITVLDPAGAWAVPVGAAHLTGPLPAADLVLVLVKSYQTADVAAHAARARAAGGLILSLQNGRGHRQLLAAAGGEADLALGVTSAGAHLVAPGVVRPAGAGPTILGRTPSTAERLAAVADRLQAAGFATELTDDIEPVLWRKLAVNAAINGLSALHGLPNGALLADPALAAELEALAREVGAVAAAQGIELGADAAALAREVARATAGNRSSMLQDMERGRPLESEAIYDPVLGVAAALGIPTPATARLLERLRAASATSGADWHESPNPEEDRVAEPWTS